MTHAFKPGSWSKPDITRCGKSLTFESGATWWRKEVTCDSCKEIVDAVNKGAWLKSAPKLSELVAKGEVQ